MNAHRRSALSAWPGRFGLGPTDLLRDRSFRRLWAAVLTSSFGAQIMLLGLPLTAAVLLHASPSQMGILTAMELLPFGLLSLPSGVWIDRLRKLPLTVGGELVLAAAAASVPFARWAELLSVDWLYAVAFVVGLVNTTAGSASQVVLTRIVERDRLIEANAKNALANSGAEIAGPGVAGVLIRLLGAQLALLVTALLLLGSAALLSGIRLDERLSPSSGRFGTDLVQGLRFVGRHPTLPKLAGFVATWELCFNAAVSATILFATRILQMNGQNVGLSYVCLGVGTVLASLTSERLGRRFGPGSCLTIGFASSAFGWLLLACAPAGPLGVVLFPASLTLFGFGALTIFINFIAVRQALTPTPLLGRMTSIMRWLITLPGIPGALIGGWLGEHFGLRVTLAFAGLGCTGLTLVAARSRTLRGISRLPVIELPHAAA